MHILFLTFTLLLFVPLELVNANELLKKLENKNKTQTNTSKIISSNEIIFDCKVIIYQEYDFSDKVYKAYKRANTAVPIKYDGYIHLNFNENYIISNLLGFKNYEKIVKGFDKKLNTDLYMSTGDKTFSVTAVLDIPFKEKNLRVRNEFSIDKYNLKMIAQEFKIFDDETAMFGKRVDENPSTYNYQCQKRTKPNF